MKKRLSFVLAICVVLSIFAFTGCSKKGVGDGDDTVLSMATNATFPPYEYYEGGEIIGIDAEIAGAIADKLGMTLVIEDMDFDSIISAITSNKVDIGVAGITVTEDRLENVNFSTSYTTGVQVVVLPEGSEIADIDMLLSGEYSIGVQLNTTGDILVTGDLEETGTEPSRYNKGADAIQALTSGKIDAVVIDDEPAKAFVEANEGLYIMDTEYAVEEYAIAVGKNNSELLEQINTALDELIADGTVQSIIDKYIGD